MDGNSTSGTKTFGSSSTSSKPSLLDSTMPPIANDNVECVGVGSTAPVGTQNPNSALPPKPKKFEQTSMVLKILIQLPHQNLRNLSKHQWFMNILPR
jgi:hypothetical protein